MEMNLKLLRKLKNKTQEELAEELNIQKQTYQNYELQKREPNTEILCKLADYYNVTLDYLVGRKNKNEIGYLNETQLNAVNLIKSLNDLNLAKAIAYMSGLIVNQN